MDPVNVFLSGLGGAVLGSIIALAGAYAIEERDDGLKQPRRDTRAVGRAVPYGTGRSGGVVSIL